MKQPYMTPSLCNRSQKLPTTKAFIDSQSELSYSAACYWQVFNKIRPELWYDLEERLWNRSSADHTRSIIKDNLTNKYGSVTEW